MLSRAQRLDQVLIVKSLDEAKIRTSKIGLTELERLKSISYNENPSPWYTTSRNDRVKVASLNCAGLAPHYIDVLADEKMLNADIIHLLETSIESTEESKKLSLEGYQSHFINIGRGKGIVTYFKVQMFSHENDFVAPNMQVTKLSSHNLDVFSVYRSSNGNSLELLNRITELLTRGKPTLITGDFNICMLNHSKNRMSKGLMQKGFHQMIKNATHIRGGHIDHVYWKNYDHVWKEPHLELYCPYYSDHDASLITLVKTEIN